MLYNIILFYPLAYENELKLSAVNIRYFNKILLFFNRNFPLLGVKVRHLLETVIWWMLFDKVVLRMFFNQSPFYSERTSIVLVFYIYWFYPAPLVFPSLDITSIRAATFILGCSRPVEIYNITNVHNRPILPLKPACVRVADVVLMPLHMIYLVNVS